MALSPDLVEIATRQQVLLEGLKQNEVAKFNPILAQIDQAIREKLTRDDLSALSRHQLELQLGEIRAAMAAILDGYTVQLHADLGDIAEHQAQSEGKALGTATTSDWSAALPTLDRLKAAVDATPLSVHGADGGRLFADVVKDWTEAEVDAVTGTIRKGYVQGNTTQQIIQAIRGTKAKNYADGLLDLTSRNAETIIRTGVQHVANAARYTVWEDNSELVQGYGWISTLDSRTTVICRSLDGRVFKLGKGPLPPAHYKCRSTTAAELDPKFKYLTAGATRASQNGQVSADLNYYGWLKTQSKAFQDQVLGPERAQLFRDGGLSPERFAALQLDRNFKPLTLDQMRKLEPLAFERAGLDVAFRQPPPVGITRFAAEFEKTEPDVSTPLKKAVVAVENEVRNRQDEVGTFIDDRGNILLQKVGLPDRVTYTNAELFRMGGATFTHNHPGGASFSLDDVAHAATWDFAEVRAVTKEMRFSIIPGPDGWPSVDKLAVAHAAEETTARANAVRAMLSGEMGGYDANGLYTDAIWLKLAKQFGLVYNRERS